MLVVIVVVVLVIIVVVVVVVVILIVLVVLIASEHRLHAAEQSMAFALGTSCEIELSRHTRTSAVSKAERPETFNYQGLSGTALDETIEVAMFVKSHNGAAAEVAYEEFVLVLAERAWCEHDAPRRVNRS